MQELDWIGNRARLTPEAEAVADAARKKTWSYAELNQRSTAAAAWLLKRGIQKGDRVALLAPNHICYFDLFFACAKIGAIFVPINWRLAGEEIEYILQDCTPKLAGVHPSFRGRMEDIPFLQTIYFAVEREEYLENTEWIPVEAKLSSLDPLAIIYTGGTTGKAKGVVLSYQSIFYNAVNTIMSWNLTSHDVTITYMPLFHTGGLNALSIPLLLIGGKVVLADDYRPEEAVRYLIDYQCTIILLVPTMYHMMIRTEVFQKQTFSPSIVFLSGGAPCPLEIYAEFERKGLQFKEGYGLTEAGPNNFYMDLQKVHGKRGSVGQPMLLNEVKIIRTDGSETAPDETGELLLKGKHLFTSYWNNAEATAEVLHFGWLHTGDLARRDRDGFYYIAGRKKDMIITGGENVYPLEVEHWISSLPQVSETAVVGIPDAKWGEKVTAFIVLQNKTSLTLEELKQHCQVKLGSYKIPKEIIFLKELPKTPVGKIDKNQLKQFGMKQV
ncbi:acyl-CoA synthetase [Bacillus benzoevorans]|uniref:Fatty-acyl-CoA synthase n=1 Tax=Bacillus benzoevorans TaxID=1456 RepID=A0A7X0HVI3_9BACI|nr:long-chain fatty acid--CoA ligase [Bacillus benzoevorans]MBB6446390.1 fatty-acyl-CoA synthase [Bacillus benzoevorans]